MKEDNDDDKATVVTQEDLDRLGVDTSMADASDLVFK